MKNFQSGRLVQHAHYKSLQPDPINRAWVVDNMGLLQLLGWSDRDLGSRTANAQKVMYYLYQRPVLNAAKVSEVAGVSPASAYRLIADLDRFGILKGITGGKRGKMYVFDAYLKLFK